MLLFVIPLKSRQISQDWATVCALLQRTVRSLLAQTSPHYRILIVGHEPPELPADLALAPVGDVPSAGLRHRQARVRFMSVDFPPPPEQTVDQFRKDKTRKLTQAIALAQQENFDYMMVVDADDCLHCGLVQHLDQHPSPTGWYLTQGYIYPEGSRWIYYRSKAFNHRCGSVIISPPASFAQSFIKQGMFMHSNEKLHDDRPLQPLPFPGAVYITAHGDNLLASRQNLSELKQRLRAKGWRAYCRDLLQWRPLWPGLRRRFGLYHL